MQHHTYSVLAHWTGGRDGEGGVSLGESGFEAPLQVAPEFGGPGGDTNPEELLTSAVAACYSITLGIVTKNRRLPVRSIEVDAEGRVDQEGVNYTFAAIVLRPRITVAEDATDAQIESVIDSAHKAERYCVITNAVRGQVAISVEPVVVRG